MKNQEKTPLEFIYKEKQIHFLINPTDKHVMINATEMGKMFGKRTDHYLQNESTKALIEELKLTEMSGTLANNQPPNGGQIIDNRGRNGIYFNEILALDFAAWLDVKFRLWIYKTIRDLLTKQTKKVKKSFNEIQIAEKNLKDLIENAKKEGNQGAIDIVDAISRRNAAATNKTKALREFTKQMKMDI